MFSCGESDKKLAWTKRLGQQKQIRLLWWQIVTTVLCTTTRTPHPNTFLIYPPPACFTTEQSTVKASLVVKSSIKLNLDTVYLQIPWKNQGVDYEQSLFFLGPSSKKALDTHITPRVTEGALVFRVSRRINALAGMHSPH